jgi:hypothetical protein
VRRSAVEQRELRGVRARVPVELDLLPGVVLSFGQRVRQHLLHGRHRLRPSDEHVPGELSQRSNPVRPRLLRSGDGVR